MKRRELLLKTLSWRITATTTTIILVYLVTRELRLAGAAAVFEMAAKSIVYYVHEAIWNKIEIISFKS